MEKFRSIIKENILIAPDPPVIFKDDLVEQIYESLREADDKIIMTDVETGRNMTGRQILKEIYCLTTNLRDRLGVNPGDVLTISSENRMDMPVIMTAAWALGAIFAPINPYFTSEENRHILKIITPKVVFCEQKVLPKIMPVLKDLGCCKAVVVFEDLAQADYAYQQLLVQPEQHVAFSWSIPIPLDSVATLFCSSGTTGAPKCVELTYWNMQKTMTNYVYGHDNYEHRVMAAFLPQYHGYGNLILIDNILRNNHAIIFKRFEITHFLRSIETYKIQTIYLVPPVMVMLAKYLFVEKIDISSITDIRCGAAPMPPGLIDTLKSILPPNTKYYEGYGLTETCICCVMTPASIPHPPKSVGLLAMGMECKVIDITTGKILSSNQKGELCFRGGLVMKGYRGNPGATLDIIDTEGWLHTGDIGYFDNDGWIYVNGRIKELIKFNAMQVSPSELEALLLQHPAVNDVAVWGLPDELAGELPLAFVVKNPGSKVTAQEIQKYVADRVSPNKKLRGGVEFVSQIPKSSAGKILRRNLKNLLSKI